MRSHSVMRGRSPAMIRRSGLGVPQSSALRDRDHGVAIIGSSAAVEDDLKHQLEGGGLRGSIDRLTPRSCLRRTEVADWRFHHKITFSSLVLRRRQNGEKLKT